MNQNSINFPLNNAFPIDHLHIWGYGKKPAGTNFIFVGDLAAELGRYVSLDPSAQGDTVEFQAFLREGTYNFTVYGRASSSRAIATFWINNNQIGITDYYASVADSRKINTFAFFVNSGLHTIKVVASGKNTSSTAYNLGLSVIYIVRQF